MAVVAIVVLVALIAARARVERSTAEPASITARSVQPVENLTRHRRRAGRH